MKMEILYRIFEGVELFINVLSWILAVYALMTWFVRPDNRLYQVVSRFCEPLLAPFRGISRKLIEKGLMIDISILLAILSLRVINTLLFRLLLLIS